MRTGHPLVRQAGASYEPAELRELFAVFDEVWDAYVADGFALGHDTALQRDRLATIILQLASDRQLRPGEMKPIATRLLRSGA